MTDDTAFRVEWFEEAGLHANAKDEIERGVAVVADALPESAMFARSLRDAHGADAEVKLWLDTGLSVGVYVAVYYEPYLEKWWFALQTEEGRERLGVVVLPGFPCVTRERAEAERVRFFDALQRALGDAAAMELGDAKTAVQGEFRKGAGAGEG